MNHLPILVALIALPALLGLLATPLVARLLTGLVRPGLWIAGISGWAVLSTLAFAAWYRHGVDQELAARAPGALMEDGVFTILAFLFWNGVLVAAVNLAAAIVGAVRRRIAR